MTVISNQAVGGSRDRKVLIIGAGPVGALTALSLHKRGWNVEVWESREDPRWKSTQMANLRSINLNISSRGLEALRSVDPSLAEMLQSESIPMKGRMIHHLDPSTPPESQIYDPRNGNVGYSLSRPILNQKLVEALPDDIKIRFQTKLSRIDFKVKRAWGIGSEGSMAYSLGDDKGKGTGIQREDKDGTDFDLIIGSDGSWSKVRQEMMRIERVDFSQSFIPHAYIELYMPPDPTKPGGYAMDPNHLHIWPRHSFMLIGLPNKDGSFTLTLFLPFSSLDTLKTRSDMDSFFQANFPSAVNITGLNPLVDGLESNPRGNLVTIHVLPTSWSSHALLLGDSSHSMVPFYGQGLNCGLEDVRFLNSILEKHHIPPTTDLPLGQTEPQLAAALAGYSDERDKDLRAICELAMNNYTEMRSKVLSPLYHLRRTLDSILSFVLPPSPAQQLSLTNPFPAQPVRGWNSLYEMVTFRPDIGYAAALAQEKWQKGVLEVLGIGAVGTGIASVGVGAWGLSRWWLRRR